MNFLILQACASYGSRPAPLVYLPTHPHLPTMGREAGLHLQHEGSYAVHCPVSVMGRDLLAVGHCHTLEMLTSLHLFSFLWVKSCFNQCLGCWVPLGTHRWWTHRWCSGRGLWAPISGDWRYHALPYPPYGGNLHLGVVAGYSYLTFHVSIVHLALLLIIILLYGYTTYCLSIHLFMNIWIVFSLGLLWILLLTQVHVDTFFLG